MTGVANSHTQAVDAVGRALAVFGEQSARAADQAAAATRRSLSLAEDAVRERQWRLADAERALRECEADPDSACGAQRQRVADATRRLAVAQEARSLAGQVVHRVSAAGRRFVAETSSRITEGRVLTSRKGAELEDYLRAVGGGPGRSGGGGSGSSAGSAGLPAGVGTAAGLPDGYGLVPLSMIDTSRDPVSGPADFTKGYSPQDLAWGFGAFDDVVLPALGGGGDVGDYLTGRDATEGRMGTRSYADTRSGFLGDNDAIVLELRPDGRFEVRNGRHRIWVAQQLGRDSVPARLT